MPAPTNAEIKAKVEELQRKLDIEQQQVADLLAEKDADNVAKQAVIDNLTARVAELEALVAEGGTSEERQAIVDGINTAIADLQATVPPNE